MTKTIPETDDSNLFTSFDVDTLIAELNCFDVAMFIADRLPGQDRFRITAINNVHESKTGMRQETSAGRVLTDLLPDDQAVQVEFRYAKAASAGKTLKYNELLDLPRGEMLWQTSIEPLKLEDDTDRIIGSAVWLEMMQVKASHILRFDDVRMFATSAAFQLSQITAFLEQVEQGHVPASRLQASASTLAGICRSIDQSMIEIRSRVEEMVAQSEARPTALIDPGLPGRSGYLTSVKSVVDDLTQLVQDGSAQGKSRSQGARDQRGDQG